ncbi:cytochrome b/b6 domain-containing protein [Thalassomonas sp. M1454]|uniref:cytochrome b/b6 domain-containing protein n=1 Tax=Thalassomonas sp. M1454 TaxID=2594477 RepID=UPI00118022D9|nr:cytochrome b/b6 domain-containing protein [Thalassomonas sp. M1454]TRX58016.1 hypothetical protein FNN08_01110 [Thalassomonas sp. M1454]
MSSTHLGWDYVVRLGHWLVALFFIANVYFIDPDGFISDYLSWSFLPEFIADASLHEWLGWSILAILVVRLIWGFTLAKGPNQLSSFTPKLADAKQHLQHIKAGVKQQQVGHNSFGALAVYVMWAGLIFIALTGWGQDTDWGFDNDVDQWHEWAVDALTYFIGLHIIAVVVTSIRVKQSLIRAMVTGNFKQS